MLFGLFEKYTATSDPSSRKQKFPTLKIKKTPETCFEILSKKLEHDGFYNINANEEFHDLYGEKRGFEVSIQIAQDGFNSLVGMSVFGEHKRGTTRGFFKRYYAEVKKALM